MNTYLVSYDLRSPGKDYSTLHEHLKSYGTWAKPLESVWLIKSTGGAERIRNDVQVYIDNNDKIFVVDVTEREAAWAQLEEKVSEWISNDL
jgi:hypothetical protein